LLSSNLSNFLVKLEDLYTISIPELPPHRKQACFDRKRDFMMTNINFPVADIKFSISPIPEASPQGLFKKSDRLLDSKNNY
jgi:hypothetical protein